MNHVTLAVIFAENFRLVMSFTPVTLVVIHNTSSKSYILCEASDAMAVYLFFASQNLTEFGN